jgi:hypothetical protein
MPYDPNIPADHADLTGAMFRGQFTGLKDLIDAVSGVTSAVVDAVNSTDPGTPAVVNVSVIAGVLHFTFDLPQGFTGEPGPSGGDGATGPPFAQCVVDGVTTLDPNEPASVDSTFDGSTVHLTFSIPRGADGNQGAQGEPGGPGEVTLQQLTDAIATTSSNAVNTLGMAVSDPPTQGEVQQIADKLDELILALRR